MFQNDVRAELGAPPGSSTGCLLINNMMKFSIKAEHISSAPPFHVQVQRDLLQSISRDALKRASSVTPLMYDWLCVVKKLIEKEQNEALAPSAE